MEMLNDGVSQLLSGIVAIILSVVAVIGVYVLAYLRKKMKLQDQEALAKLAEEAVFEAEESSRGKVGLPNTRSGVNKESDAINSLIDKAKSAGIKLAKDKAGGLARAAVRGALGRLRKTVGF